MKQLLNTLYVTTQGLYLSKTGETLFATLKGEKVSQLPLLNLSGIVCFGNVLCSPFLLGACAEHGIGVSFLTANGRFLARVQGAVSGNVLLRREQYRQADDPEKCLRLAGSFIAGKLINSRQTIMRFRRDHPDRSDAVLEEIALYFRRQIAGLKNVQGNLEALRGVEGEAAARYFAVFNAFITTQKDVFQFSGRNRRPPLDPVNALLSFVYTLLMHDITGALESVGLDPAVGFLHKDRPGRASLALDMMEEFRPYLADRLVLTLINLKKITGKGFKISESGAVLMDDTTKKTVISAYQERKKEEMIHPYLQEKMKCGLLPFVQALLLARYLRGELNTYPPFIVR